jgi:hypothetical protein
MQGSGKRAALPPLLPLRTVRASFPAYGSNLQTKFCLRQNRLSYYKFTNVYLLVTVRVKQDPVGQLV